MHGGRPRPRHASTPSFCARLPSFHDYTTPGIATFDGYTPYGLELLHDAWQGTSAHSGQVVGLPRVLREMNRHSLSGKSFLRE